MANFIADIALTSLETITCFDITTGAYLFQLDELQSANISQSEEKVDITGRQGRKLAAIKRNKAVTVSGSNGLVSTGLWEKQTGSDFKLNTAAEVAWTDYLKVEDNEAETSWKAIGDTGAEIDNLYIKNADGTLGQKIDQAAAAAEGKFAYAPSTKKLTFSDLADGTEIVVFYKRKITASVLSNASDKYSGKCTMYIDAIGEDTCANVYHVQICVPKADFSGEFSFDMGDNQTVHSFEAEALAGSCGSNGEFFTYTIFASNAEDVTA